MSIFMYISSMTKLRKIHYVIHNQGAYATDKKDQLLVLLKEKYGDNLEGYLIAQEHYKHDVQDTHLQGNLFFKHAIHFTALLKLLKNKYKETHTDVGLKGRIDLSAVLHEGRAYNYMINSSKEGGDPSPISDNTMLDKRRQDAQFTNELILILQSSYERVHRVRYNTHVWQDHELVGDRIPPYVPVGQLNWNIN